MAQTFVAAPYYIKTAAVGLGAVSNELEQAGRYLPLIGMLVGAIAAAVLSASAVALLDADGRFRVILGTVDLTGSFTSLAQVAAQEFGVSPEKVLISKVSTDAAPFAPESSGSQTLIAMGAAVQMAARNLKAKVMQNAARALSRNGAADR